MYIIGVTGKAGAGKDTVADFMVNELGFAKLRWAAALKRMLAAGLGLTEEDFDTLEKKEANIPWLGKSYRHLAQTLGTQWGRECVRPDLWVLLVRQEIVNLYHAIQRGETDAQGVVVSDTRFENEAVILRQMGGSVWHIESNRETTAHAHASEAGIEFHVAFDQQLLNYGTMEQLRGAVRGALTFYDKGRPFAGGAL